MCEDMHGDPEVIRRFAERLTPCGAFETVTHPEPTPCAGGMQACGTFAAADAVSTLALMTFLSEVEETVTTLGVSAAATAGEYEATDAFGAQAVARVSGVPGMEC